MVLNAIEVEVAFASPQGQWSLTLTVEQGTTLVQVLRMDAVRERFAGVDPEALRFGVFGRERAPDYVLDGGDRIELYRPLVADPKVRRRERAAKARR